MIKIIGTATTNTNDTTYDNFVLSPLIAPAVATAADTPQMETALESINDISLSIFILRHNQKQKFHTVKTTTQDCINPNAPAFNKSSKSTVVPSNTKPIFTNSSEESDSFNHLGIENILLMKSPINKLNITVSNPQSFRNLFPPTTMAKSVRKNTTGKLATIIFNFLPVNNPAINAIRNIKQKTIRACPTLSKVKILFINASASGQLKEGQ